MRRLSIVLVVTVIAAAARPAAAIERLLPVGRGDPPVLAPDQAVLFILREQQVVGESCDEPRVPDDTGVPDAGVPDAGIPDAGGPDAGVADGGAGDPDPCEPVLRDTVTMIVQPRFIVPAEGSAFAVLFVTPRPPEIEVAPEDLFEELAEITAPEVVIDEIFVEDPDLGYDCDGSGSHDSVGCGSVSQTGDDVSWDPPERSDAGIDDAPMPEVVTVGSYEVVRVVATDRAELAGWLDTLGYRYQPQDLDAIEPYLAASYTITAVRVSDANELATGLEPLALTWIGEVVRVPLGLARQPDAIDHSLQVYVAGPGRYQLADGRVAFAGATAMDAMDGATYLTRTDLVVDLSRAGELDPVAFRVPGDPEYRDVLVVPQTVRVPSMDCPPSGGGTRESGGCNESDDDGCWCASGGDSAPTPEFALLVGITAWLAMRRRRP